MAYKRMRPKASDRSTFEIVYTDTRLVGILWRGIGSSQLRPHAPRLLLPLHESYRPYLVKRGQLILAQKWQLARFRRVRKTAKREYYFRHICLSVHLSAKNNSAPTGWILIKFDTWAGLRIYARILVSPKFSLETTCNSATHCWKLQVLRSTYAFLDASSQCKFMLETTFVCLIPVTSNTLTEISSTQSTNMEAKFVPVIARKT